MAVCGACGANFPDIAKFCTQCSEPKSEAAAVEMPGAVPPQQYQPASQHMPEPRPGRMPVTAPNSEYAPIPRGAPYGVAGTGTFLGLTCLFAIPAIGWLICVVMAFAAKNRNIRNFARAHTVFVVIGIALLVVFYFFFEQIIVIGYDFMVGFLRVFMS